MLSERLSEWAVSLMVVRPGAIPPRVVIVRERRVAPSLAGSGAYALNPAARFLFPFPYDSRRDELVFFIIS